MHNSPLSSNNVRNWASDSTAAGRLAAATDSYNMYLLDDSTVQGDITPSLVSQANNKLHIDTTAGQSIAGVIANFGSSVDINKGGSLATQWKDAAFNTPAFNPTLMIAAGSGTVTFTGANTYRGATNIGAGTLKLSGSGSINDSAAINVGSGAAFDVTGVAAPFQLGAAKSLVNNGTVSGLLDTFGMLGGSGRFTGRVMLGNGAHVAPGDSIGTLTFAGGLALSHGSALDFEVGAASDKIMISGGNLTGSDLAGVSVNFKPGPGFVRGGTYTLLDWSGAGISGVDVSDFTSSSGYVGSFQIVGSTLQATVTPEPSTWVLMCLGAAALIVRPIRKRLRTHLAR